MSRKLTFAYPGELSLQTGGYAYDRKLIAGLQALGWELNLLPLGDGFPNPAPEVRHEAERRLSALPDGTRVLIDGLAFGILDDWAAQQATRLSLFALVHHPLALETGLGLSEQQTLKARETRALRFTQHTFVTSPATARELIAGFGVPESAITVALPGTDVAPVSPCDGDPPQILSIGTLIPRKGHDVLIDALKQVEDLAWHATIVGSRTLHAETAAALDAQVTALGLQERVRLVGVCEDTRALLAKADLFALASRYEGFGMVFAEALSQGLPIVACRTGAVPDVVPAAAGLLVPVDDPAAFAGALRRLLNDKSLHQQMARAARQVGADLPGWDDTALRISQSLENRL